ncbi:MAG: zinc-dependent metalloprotease [Proteobacteria bacterium]|jgi:hypothetical protein|nr:zinc-dependent metalloprotease [Pseudomonadota bacterium]
MRKTLTSKKPVKAVVGLFLASSLGLSACTTEKRGEQFVQGQGQNLVNPADYDGKTFEITTLGEESNLSAQSTQIRRNSVSIQSTQHQMVALPFVKYESTDKKLLSQNIPFKGRPNTKGVYQGMYKLTDNYLKIFKVAKAQDIDKDEATSAEVLADGRLAVPLMAYSVRYLKVERVKNSDNEDTKTKAEYSVQTRAEANAMRIDYNSAQLFESISKNNVFRSQYFTGEWFFAETIVAAPAEEQVVLGFGNGIDQNLQSTTRIKFIQTESYLKAVNVNIDDRLDKNDDVNLATVISIPARWKDFEAIPQGRDKALREREVTTRDWSERKYIELDFEKLQNIDLGNEFTESVGQNFFSGAKLVGLELNDDYFSFVIHNQSTNQRVRWAFKRATTSNYMSKRHFEEDFKKFGFFTTEKAVVNNFEIRRQEDVERNIFISRFNPANKEIQFRFSKTTPEWLRPAAVEAIEAWNKAFQVAGTGIQITIKLEKENDVELGDIRYNIINLVESLTEGNLFGFGPSLTDPRTGEIISATSNVHVTPIRSALVEEIKGYLKMKTGQLDSSYFEGIGALLNQILGTSVAMDPAKDKAEITGFDLANVPGLKAYFMTDNGEMTQKNLDFARKYKNYGREYNLSISSKNIHEDIEKQCPEVVEYVAELQKLKETYNEKELKVLDSCSRKLVLGKMKGTLIHEMGHNFGLRHNFAASTDKDNFFIDGKCGQDGVRSSSVMEYTAFNEDRLVTPGCYDIAAIRYGYADSFETKTGESVLLNTDKTIAQNLQVQNKDMNTFKFCTDDHVAIGLDPMCQRHDAGLTPIEVVTKLIAEYNSSVATLNYRYDNVRGINPNRLAAYRMGRFMIPMKRFYDEWRTQLARYLGQDSKYIENMDAQAYQSKVQAMMNDTTFGPIARAYKPAADLAYNFLMTVATLPDKYCVVKKQDGSIDLMNLEKARQKIYFSSQISTASCEDEAIAAQAQSSMGGSIVGESGHFLDSIRFDLSPEKLTKPFDVVGTRLDRMNAMLILTARVPTSYAISANNLRFSFTDEPQYRAGLINQMAGRALLGLNPNLALQSFKGDKAQLVKVEKPFQKYSGESNLIRDQLVLLYHGLGVPSAPAESGRRKTPFNGFITNDPQVVQQSAASFQLRPGQYFVVMNPDAKISIMIIEELGRLDSLKRAAPLNDQVIQQIQKMLTEYLPAKDKAQEIDLKTVLGLAQGLEQNAAKNPLFGLIALSLNELLKPIQEILGAKMTEAGQDQAKVEQLLTLKIQTLFAEAKAENNVHLEGLMVEVKKASEANKALAAEYQANKAEYDAKYEMLVQYLMYREE